MNLVTYEDDCILGYCAIITPVMKAASISETSVNFYQSTQRSIPEDQLSASYSPPG
jgi:hypothetical protein